jgi:3-methyladenine DNA glycosylase AlkD
MKNIIIQIQREFIHYKQKENALKMEKYMKDLFTFYGIPSPLRKEIQQKYFKQLKWKNDAELWQIIHYCWNENAREMQYLALDILIKYKKKISFENIREIEYILCNKSWWDTVDTISAHIVGEIFLNDIDEKQNIIHSWLRSNNIWLQRACIIHQLKYKNNVDEKVLENCIEYCILSKEFFINKAIGWALREYSKKNPDYVRNILTRYNFSNLSKKEASKYI